MRKKVDIFAINRFNSTRIKNRQLLMQTETNFLNISTQHLGTLIRILKGCT